MLRRLLSLNLLHLSRCHDKQPIDARLDHSVSRFAFFAFDVLQMCVKTRRKKKPSGRDMFVSTVNPLNGRNGVEGVEIPPQTVTVTGADKPQSTC